MNLWNRWICYCRRHSPWLFHMNSGSCNGCDIELVAALAPRYDAEQIGALLQGSPRHADILCITGPVTQSAVGAVKTVYGQVLRSEGGCCHRIMPGLDQRLYRQQSDRRPVASSYPG